MKKIIGGIIALGCLTAIVLAGGESVDGSCNIGWTFVCLAVALIAGTIWNIFFAEDKIHIGDDVYDDLNDQIECFIEKMDEGEEKAEFDSEGVTVIVSITKRVTKYRFTDNAWGSTQTFTEYNDESTVEVLDVKVYDENDKETDRHDFNERKIIFRYESTIWD